MMLSPPPPRVVLAQYHSTIKGPLSITLPSCVHLCSSMKLRNDPEQTKSEIDLLYGIMFSQCVRTHTQTRLASLQSPSVKVISGMRQILSFYRHQIRSAVWSGLFGAAVWKMKSLCFCSMY